jgi:hypothetical protein
MKSTLPFNWTGGGTTRTGTSICGGWAACSVCMNVCRIVSGLNNLDKSNLSDIVFLHNGDESDRLVGSHKYDTPCAIWHLDEFKGKRMDSQDQVLVGDAV